MFFLLLFICSSSKIRPSCFITLINKKPLQICAQLGKLELESDDWVYIKKYLSREYENLIFKLMTKFYACKYFKIGVFQCSFQSWFGLENGHYLWKYVYFKIFKNPFYILVKSGGFGRRVNHVQSRWFLLEFSWPWRMG